MTRICRIVVVCEDWQHSAFARGFLSKAGVGYVVERKNPRGSGHDWVKEQFIAEVANLARFSEGCGVLGLVDEDGTGTTRHREVAERLKAAGHPPVAPEDGRCLLLPTEH